MAADRGFLDLIISLLPGLLPFDKINLSKLFSNEEEIYLLTKNKAQAALKRRLKKDWDITAIRDKADFIDTVCRARSIKWVSWNNLNYPPLLREIYDPPLIIYYRGFLPDPEKSLLGMVGTRKPSPEAASQAYKTAYGIGKAGISVVSGLALGIDSMSHRGNLAGGVPGYAVLGSGTDEIYPRSNRVLAKKILDSGGALISEYPPGTHPAKWSFPARNRIIAGLSRGLVIAEAPGKSGSLITAEFALQQGKDIFICSQGAESRDLKYDKSGTKKLLDDGAEIIYSEFDIFEKWNIMIADNNNYDSVSAGNKCTKEIISSMADFLKIEV